MSTSNGLKLEITIDANGNVTGKLKEASQAVDEVSRKTKEAAQSFDVMDASVSSVRNQILALAGAFTLVDISKEVIKATSEFQRLKAALETVEGSAYRADMAFEQISAFAQKTPYELAEVTDAFIKMKALGLDASEEAMRSYGDTASGLGKPLMQMIEAVADAATGEFERLKEFGIKASNQGDIVKFTFKGVTDSVANNAKSIEQYLIKLGNVNFAGGMERQSQTLGGAISNMSDKWSNALVSIGTATEPAIRAGISGIGNLADSIAHASQYIDEAAKVAGVGLTVALTAKAIPAIWATSTALNAGMVAAGGFTAAITAATVAAARFAVTPAGLALTAMGAAAAYLTLKTDKVAEAIEEVTAKSKELNIEMSQNEIKKQAEQLVSLRNELKSLMQAKAQNAAIDVVDSKQKSLEKQIYETENLTSKKRDLTSQTALLLAQETGMGTQLEMLYQQNRAFGISVEDTSTSLSIYNKTVQESYAPNDKLLGIIGGLQEKYALATLSARDAAIAQAKFAAANKDGSVNKEYLDWLEQWTGATYDLGESKKSATTASKAHTKEIKDETKAHLEYLKAIQNDGYDAFEQNIKSIEDYNKSQADSLKSLQDTLNPTMALYRKYGEDVLLLNQQFAQGNMYVADYEGAVGSLKNKLIKDIDGIETYSKSVKTLSESLKDFGNVSFSKTSDPLVDSMGSLLETTGKMMTYYDQEKQHLDDIAKKRAEIANTQFASDKERAQAIQELGKLESDFTANATRGSLAMYSNMAGAAAGLFDQNSKEQKALMQVQKAMTIATLALDAQKMASALGLIGVKTTEATVAGTAAVLTQGSGDPYSAWVRMAAMAATVGALLGAIGGGSPSVSGASVPQAKGGDGASSPLGSTDPSKSASESLKYMQDIEANQYKELRNIFKEMQDLNSNITGFATALYTTGDIRSIGTNVSGLGTTYNTQGIVDFGKSISKSLGLYDMPIIGGLIKGLDSFAGDLLNSAFGGTTKKAVGSGIYLGDFALGKNADLQSYTRIKKTSSGPFGSFSSSDRYDSFQDIQGQSEQAFQKIFDNLHDGMIDIGIALGKDITAKVDAFKVSIGKIETSGKTGAEIEQALQEAISTQTDKLAYAMFPDMVNKYAQLNEGYFETLTRLVTDKAVVEQTLGDMGITIKAGSDIIKVSESIVSLSGSLNDFVSNANDFVDAFYTDEQKQKINTDLVTSLFDGLGNKLPTTEAGLVSLVKGLNLTTKSGQNTYTAILSNSQALDQYYESLKTTKQTAIDAKNAEKAKTADLKKQLLELTNPTKALKQARDAELKGLTATQQATQKRIWALQDEKLALDNLKNAQANYQSSLKSLYDFGQNIKDTITGIQQEAVQQKDSAQSAFDGSAKSIADYANSLTAQMEQINKDIASNFKEVSTVISDYLDSLKLDKNDTNADKLTYYRNNFETTLSKANAGDIEAAKALPEISQNLLDASYEQASSFEDYLKEKSTVASKLYAVEALAVAKYTASQTSATDESDDLTVKLKALQSTYDALTKKVKDAGGDIGEIVTKFGSTSNEIDKLIDGFVTAKKSLSDATKQYYEVRANEMVALSSLVDQYNASVILLNLYNKEIEGIDFASVSDPLLAFKTGLSDVVTAFNTAKAELATAQKTAANASVAVATTASEKSSAPTITPISSAISTPQKNLSVMSQSGASINSIISYIDSNNFAASSIEKALGVKLDTNQSGLIKLISSGANTDQIGAYIDSKNMTASSVSSALGTSVSSVKSALGGSTSKFSNGGYTGDGGKYDPAGIVHKGEFVVPAWMVNDYPHAVHELETIRKRGFAEGGAVGFTAPVTRVGTGLGNSDNNDIAKLLKEVRDELKESNRYNFEITKNTGKTKSILDRIENSTTATATNTGTSSNPSSAKLSADQVSTLMFAIPELSVADELTDAWLNAQAEAIQAKLTAVTAFLSNGILTTEQQAVLLTPLVLRSTSDVLDDDSLNIQMRTLDAKLSALGAYLAGMSVLTEEQVQSLLTPIMTISTGDKLADNFMSLQAAEVNAKFSQMVAYLMAEVTA